MLVVVRIVWLPARTIASGAVLLSQPIQPSVVKGAFVPHSYWYIMTPRL